MKIVVFISFFTTRNVIHILAFLTVISNLIHNVENKNIIIIFRCNLFIGHCTLIVMVYSKLEKLSFPPLGKGVFLMIHPCRIFMEACLWVFLPAQIIQR